MKKPNYIPEGYHTITPYIMAENIEEYSTFLQNAFNGMVTSTTNSANGKPLNIGLKIGSSMVMIAEARGDFEPMTMSFYMYVENVDSSYEIAVKNGAKSLYEPSDQFYGSRDCGVIDVRGNYWFIGTLIE